MKVQVILLATVFAAVAAQGARVRLIRAGEFANVRGARFEQTGAGRELVIPKPGASAQWRIPLDPKWAVLNLTGEIRATDVPKGKANWQNGRFAMEWKDAQDRTLREWPRNDGFAGTTDWIKVDYDNPIPTNAASVVLSICNLSSGGEVRFRNVTLSVVREHAGKPGNAELPEGAPADAESLSGAWTAKSSTRTRYSLNGLWRIRPSFEGEDGGFVPEADDNWAWDKIPEVWPVDGSAFCGSRYLAPWVMDHVDLRRRMRAYRAWYGRKFRFPPEAVGMRTLLTFEMIASRAIVYVDGKKAGAVEFPCGEVDLTDFVRPGDEQFVELDVTAYPAGETLNYNEATRANKEKKVVKFKGVTGDLWLDLVPAGLRLDDAYAETSVEKGEIAFCAAVTGNGVPVSMKATVEGCGETRTFEGRAVKRTNGTYAFIASWADAKLWDTHTPQNLYSCRIAVLDATGRTLDESVPFTFGFREVKIVGRDFFLNGTRIHLRALYNDSGIKPWIGSSKANAAALFQNLIANGYNFTIAGNYSYNAGAVVYQKGILEACDATGMLHSYTLPHFKDFGLLDTPEKREAYRRMTAGIVRLVRNHPSVISYATSHNAAGYLGAGNPLRIDGKYELPASANGVNRTAARIARRLIGEIDATRPCYHHESGNLDDFHTVNCYLNWSPVQERSDWLEHWATEGMKPLFFVEWGLPHISSWSSYRGPLFIWHGTGYMSLWSAEYAAAYRDDLAYEPTQEMRTALKAEEKLWAAGAPFRWLQLVGHCESVSNNYFGVQATMADDNWRSFRGWGITAMLPWDQDGFVRRVHRTMPPADYNRWADLKKPGYAEVTKVQWADSADYELTAIGAVMRRWNMPDCAWIAGDGSFTDKRHLFRPGDPVRKTLMILNDRRTAQTVEWTVSSGDFRASGEVRVAAGDRAQVPFEFAAAKSGDHEIYAEFRFEGGVVQDDSFRYTSFDAAVNPQAKIALYDPKGLTAANLKRLGISFVEVKNLAEFDTSLNGPNRKTRLLIGRESLTAESVQAKLVPFAWSSGCVIVFEQPKAVLEEVGFRAQTYGMRHAYPRYRKMKLADLQRGELLRDWAGSSTLVEEHTPLKAAEMRADQDMWSGYCHSRVWRNGNRGAVATVILEKPAIGDWCALADGAFDLQYSPLLEWRVGDGSITFCQFDVTGRTEPDPAADDLVRRLIAALDEENPHTTIAYPRGKMAYDSALVRGDWVIAQDENKLDRRLFYITDGADDVPAGFHAKIKAGATALLCGLSAAEVKKWSPVPLPCVETNACGYSRIEKLPPELNGLSNGDWAWHGLMDFAAFTDTVEDGNNAIRVVRYGKGRLVFWQVPPWKIDAEAKPYLRTSKRRAEAMLSRLMGNLGFNRSVRPRFYADVPVPTDDPYRYFHW